MTCNDLTIQLTIHFPVIDQDTACRLEQFGRGELQECDVPEGPRAAVDRPQGQRWF